MIELGEIVLLAIGLYIVITFAIQTVHVIGYSMLPTLNDNDYVLATKIDLRFSNPSRSDIVILKDPFDSSQDFVKRVIALPGEKLLIRDGSVYINGHKLDEPYLPEAWTAINNPPPWSVGDGAVIPANQYFVMGDNRNRSQDSRLFGPIGRDRIDGRAWFRIWPLDHFGDIYGLKPTLEGAGQGSG